MNFNFTFKKIIFVLLILCNSSLQAVFDERYRNLDEENRIRIFYFSPEVTSLPISDWQNPTYEDYLLIQKYFKSNLTRVLEQPVSSRPFDTDRLNNDMFGWVTYRLGRLKLIDTPDNLPSLQVDYLGNDPNQREKCIICYAGYNMPGTGRDYRKGLEYILKSLKYFHFKGHFIYRIGGWPNLKNDRLKYVDVPYAFKPFFFEEVRDMGYKEILWLDAAAVPIKGVDPLFDQMERFGCCFFSQGKMSPQYLIDMEYVRRALGISGNNYLALLSQVVGINVNNPVANELLDRWIQAAERKVAFLEPSGDQLSFSFLVNELGLLQGQLPHTYYVEGANKDFYPQRRNREAIILHQYDFLDPDIAVPDDIFK